MSMAASQAYQNYLEQLADYESKRAAYEAAGKKAPTFSFQTPETRIAIPLETPQAGTLISGISQPLVNISTPVDEFIDQFVRGGGEVKPITEASLATGAAITGAAAVVPISGEFTPAKMLTNFWTGDKFAAQENQPIVPLGLEQMGIPIGGSIPTWIKLLAGAGATAAGGGFLGSLLGLVSGGGTWSNLLGQGMNLLTGGESSGGIGGTSMTTGMSVDGATTLGGTVPFGGPGVPEPPAGMVAKQWKTKAFSSTKGEYWVYFFKLIDGRIICWNEAKREAKMWKPKKNMVLSNNPRLPDLLRFSKKANKMLFKLDRQADKARRQFARTK